jgi:hypothetical protein
MQLKPAVPKAPFQTSLEILRIGLAVTVHHGIVRIAGKWMIGKVNLHPFIKHIVEKKIRKHGTNHPPLAGTALPSYESSIILLERCF